MSFFALQSSGAVHLGVDNLGVVQHVGSACWMVGIVLFLLNLFTMVILLLLIDRIAFIFGVWTRFGLLRLRVMLMRVWFSMVGFGRLIGLVIILPMRLLTLGVGGLVMLSSMRDVICLVCGRWYPVILSLHRFFIAISRAVVNHNLRGGTALDPLVLSVGARPKRRRLVHAVRDRAFLPGPPGIWDSDWVSMPATSVCAADVAHWPYTPGLLVKWVAFLGTLHWPAGSADLGVGGVSYVELLILYELWAGERLSLEKAYPRYLRPGRQISVSAVPFGSGIDIWRSCRFIGAMMRSLCLLPGGQGRFVSCSIGANHCRLRHIGWEKCGHGLTSRPRESASEPFLNELLGLFRYPRGSGCALLAGTLPLRYCARSACSVPTWRLPETGHVAGLITADIGVEGRVVDCADDAVSWVRGSGSGRPRIRLNRKTPAHLVVSGDQSRPRVGKRLLHLGRSSFSIPDTKRRRGDQDGAGCNPVQIRIGVGKLPWCFVQVRVSRLACFLN